MDESKWTRSRAEGYWMEFILLGNVLKIVGCHNVPVCVKCFFGGPTLVGLHQNLHLYYLNQILLFNIKMLFLCDFAVSSPFITGQPMCFD